MKTLRTLIFFLLTMTAATSMSFAADPTGKWTWTNTGPKGRSAEATAMLRVEGAKVTGSVANRLGEQTISDGTFVDDQVRFSVMWKVRRNTFVARYAGKVEGDTLKGTIETTLKDGRPVSVPWDAKRVR